MSLPTIYAFLAFLAAFNIPQPTIDQIRGILIPVQTIQVSQETSTTTIPTFGSVVQSPIIQVPIQTPMPNWNIDVKTPYGTTAKAGVGPIRFEVNVTDKNGVFVKKPVTVTTNDPDLPSSFTINATIDEAMASGNTIGYSNFFCVAPPSPGSTVLNGCSNLIPVSVGTFDFTFTVEDVSKTVQITVTQ